MSSTVIVPRLPSGAGRIDDYTWPSSHDNNNPSLNVSPRNGPQFAGALNTGYSGGSGSSVGWIGGNECLSITCTAIGAGNGYDFTGSLRIQQRNTKAQVGGRSPKADDRAAHRIYATLALFGGTPQAACDHGLQMLQAGNNSTILINAASGYGFQFLNSNVVQFIVRGPNGLKTYNLTAAPFDTTVFHTYELRYFCCTDVADAQLVVMIDGVSMAAQIAATSLSWGAGTDLPTMLPSGGINGKSAHILARGAFAGSLLVRELRMQSAPTVADLL